MNNIHGTIRTYHKHPDCVAGGIMSDNLTNMETSVSDPHVVTAVCGNKLRSIIASVDDYLMNLAIAEDICCYVLD